MILGCYKFIAGVCYPIFKPAFLIKARLEGPDSLWAGRLGVLPKTIYEGPPPDLWLQAVSVGEVNVAEAIVKALDRIAPGFKIIISSSTPAGFARAQSLLGDRCEIIPFPLDFPQVVKRLAKQLRPRVYASLETELWPNLLHAIKAKGSRMVLLNGRISKRSFPLYKKIRSLTIPVLSCFSKLCAISDIHAQRLEELGAPRDKILVTGNAKFEGLLDRPSFKKAKVLKEKLSIREDVPVWVAGSIRGGEEPIIVKAYSKIRMKHPELVVFLVPRHLEGVERIEGALKSAGFPFQLWSEIEMGKPRRCHVVLVDVIGPLFDLYGLATVAFVGGSLVPKGGQNIMEPAAWGCPIIYGPHTDNFDDARISLDKIQGGITVEDEQGLVEKLDMLLKDVKLAKEIGQRARKALEAIAQGAASKQAEVILEQFRKSKTKE